MKQKHFIDSHKGATAIYVLLLMLIYKQWGNYTLWVYWGLHGTYGVLWILKSKIFPDKQWEQQCSIWYGLYIWFGLSLYWIGPWLIASKNWEAPAWYIGMCVSMYVFGVFFHFSADMQKHISLQLRPGKLITSGLWARCRNPNYFGELLIYLGFSLLAMHWMPLLALALFMIIIWFPNMRKKDISLSRYPEFAAYKKQAKLLIPFVF